MMQKKNKVHKNSNVPVILHIFMLMISFIVFSCGWKSSGLSKYRILFQSQANKQSVAKSMSNAIIQVPVKFMLIVMTTILLNIAKYIKAPMVAYLWDMRKNEAISWENPKKYQYPPLWYIASKKYPICVSVLSRVNRSPTAFVKPEGINAKPINNLMNTTTIFMSLLFLTLLYKVFILKLFVVFMFYASAK